MQPSRRNPRQNQALAAIKAKLAQVPLDRIRVPAEVLVSLERLKPLPSLDVSMEASDALSLLRPPLLMKDASDEGGYLLLANARIIQWHQRQADLNPASRRTVRCLILAGDLSTVEKLSDIETHLVPMVLGEASARKTREARKTLRQVCVARPRKLSARERLQQNIAKR